MTEKLMAGTVSYKYLKNEIELSGILTGLQRSSTQKTSVYDSRYTEATNYNKPLKKLMLAISQ